MRIYVNDVAVRDGFQIEKQFVPTATKVELINQLSRTGLHKIEVTSFVSPKAVPMLADANDVLGGIERVPGVVYVALVPNIRGAQNAAAVAKKPDELNGVVSASETHNRANINRTHQQSLAEDAIQSGAPARRVVRSTRHGSNSLMRNTFAAAPCSGMSSVTADTARYGFRFR